MSSVYSYTFSQEGDGPWWGIRCSPFVYQNIIRQMNETQRCFVYLTNSMGETLAIAVEGPSLEASRETIFVPSWVLTRLGLYDGETVTMDPILDPLPSGTSVKIQPMTGSTVQGPMFIEGLTEALNQLGVVQEGLLSAIVDPSVPILHEFRISSLRPARVCLADGELTVDIEAAADIIELPQALATEAKVSEPIDFDAPMIPEASGVIFRPFATKGNRLGRL